MSRSWILRIALAAAMAWALCAIPPRHSCPAPANVEEPAR